MHGSTDNGHTVVWLGGSVLEVLSAESGRDDAHCVYQSTYLPYKKESLRFYIHNLNLCICFSLLLLQCTIPRHPVTATIPVATTATTTGIAAATTSRAATVVTNPVTVQMVRQDRNGVYESLPQDEQNMV